MRLFHSGDDGDIDHQHRQHEGADAEQPQQQLVQLSPQTGSGDKHERQQQQGAEKQQNGRYLMPGAGLSG